MSSAELQALRPKDLTVDICKTIFSMFWTVGELGEYIYRYDLESEKLKDMQPETLEKYHNWHSKYIESSRADREKYIKPKSRSEPLQDNKRPTRVIDGKIVPARKIELVTAKQLKEMKIPELQWLVCGLIPTESVGLVVAPPKSFKSYLCIDLCLSICNGTKFLEKQSCKHDVLYFDFESTYRRPKTRITQVAGDQDIPDNFYIYTADSVPVGQIGSGFETSIKQIFSEHKDIALVIIDVLQYIRPKRSKTQSGYDTDYEDMRVLKDLAKEYHTAFLVVHHSRKMKDTQDVYNNVSGSAGLFGSADYAIVIDKEKRNDDFATFHITGRDIESLELRMRFNTDLHKWQYIGETQTVILQERQKAYMDNNITKSIKKELELYSGEWQGELKELKSDSKYFNFPITDDSRKIGKFISDHRDLFLQDNISFVLERSKTTKRTRIYKFSII